MNRSQEILNFYIDDLSKHLCDMHTLLTESNQLDGELACVTLPIYSPKIKKFEIDLETITAEYSKNHEDAELSRYTLDIKEEINSPAETEMESDMIDSENIKTELPDSEDIIFVMNESNESQMYRLENGNKLTKISEINEDYFNMLNETFPSDTNVYTQTKRKPYTKLKEKKKRLPMDYVSCSECPIKYRFTTKLKHHMKTEHNIDVYICKVCKINLLSLYL